jgi:hypothetical protein
MSKVDGETLIIRDNITSIRGAYQSDKNENVYNSISNLIDKSEDLDERIIDMVNENFWDLV